MGGLCSAERCCIMVSDDKPVEHQNIKKGIAATVQVPTIPTTNYKDWLMNHDQYITSAAKFQGGFNMQNINFDGKLTSLSDRANQIASMACAVSNAATYAPDDLKEYHGAMIFFASVTKQFADDLAKVASL